MTLILMMTVTSTTANSSDCTIGVNSRDGSYETSDSSVVQEGEPCFLDAAEQARNLSSKAHVCLERTITLGYHLLASSWKVLCDYPSGCLHGTSDAQVLSTSGL